MGRKPKKTDQTVRKFDNYAKRAGLIIGLIAGIVSLIPGVLTLVDKCTQQSPPTETPEEAPNLPLPPEEKKPDPPPAVIPPKEPDLPQPPQKEYKKISVTTTSIASASAFDDDVQITLIKVNDAYQQVFGKIMVYSSRESLSFQEWTTFNPQKIGSYEIDVVEIGRDYAEFRIERRQR